MPPQVQPTIPSVTEIIGRVDYLTRNNVIVAQCWQAMLAGGWKHDQFLQLAVVMLADQNERLLAELERAKRNEPPPPIHVDCNNPADGCPVRQFKGGRCNAQA